MDLVEIFVAEVIATAFLLFFGCIGLIPSLEDSEQGVPPLHPAFVCGLTVIVCLLIFGPISGAHMNPAITLCALIYRRISVLAGIVYVVAQCLGSILGIWLVKLMTPHDKYPENFCCVKIHSSLSLHQAVLSEFIGTAVLIFAICSAWDPRNVLHQDSMPIKFAAVVSSIIIAFGNYTSACINPARSLGPALIHGFWDNQWFYWIVPLSASVFATVFYKLIFLKKHEKSSNKILTEQTLENIELNQ